MGERAVATDGDFSGELPAGEHIVRIRARGYRGIDWKLVVEPGRSAALILPLEPLAATVDRDRIRLRERVAFEPGSAESAPSSFRVLDHVAEIMMTHPEISTLTIQGHTDSTGSASINLALSQARALAVRRYLNAAGVSALRLHSVGYGATRPLDPVDTPPAYTQNRRVDFFVSRAPP